MLYTKWVERGPWLVRGWLVLQWRYLPIDFLIFLIPQISTLIRRKYVWQFYTNITRTTRTPAFWGYHPPPHDYQYYSVILDPKSKKDKVKVTNLRNLPKFKIFKLWSKFYTRHVVWSCLIRCANMKWIWRVLLKIQSGHDSVHRRTDGQTDGQDETSIPPFNFVEAGA